MSGRAYVEIQASGAFARDGGTAEATVAAGGLEELNVREGDRIVLLRGRRPEHGDVAAVCLPEDDGQSSLWKVFPFREHLELSDGHRRLRVSLDTPVEGVVVAVSRRFSSRASS